MKSPLGGAEKHSVRPTGWQASGTGLALLSGLVPTFGISLPFAFRVVGVIAGLTILAWPVARSVFDQSKKDSGVLPALLIGACLVGAAIGAVWLYLARQDALTPAVTNATPSSLSTPAAVSQGLLRTVVIGWQSPNSDISFQGTFLKSGENLRAFVEWGQVPYGGTPRMAYGGPLINGGVRLEVGRFDRFVKGEQLNIALATLEIRENGDSVLQWGKRDSGYTKLGTGSSPYVGRVVFVEHDNTEDYYYFVIFPRSYEDRRNPPAVLGPDFMAAYEAWKVQAP